MADAADLKSASRKGVWVRVPPSAPIVSRTCKSSAVLSYFGPFADRNGHRMFTVVSSVLNA